MKTVIPGIVLSENMPQIAKVADKITIIRSMAGREADHGRASYSMFTGYRMSPAVKHPSLGSVVSHEFGPRNGLPAYVCVPDMREYGGTGYLSAKYAGLRPRQRSGERKLPGARSHLPGKVDDGRPLRRAQGHARRRGGSLPLAGDESRCPRRDG